MVYMGAPIEKSERALYDITFQVMDGGEVVEFDDPYTLLQDEKSQLKVMVDMTGPSSSEQLYHMHS